MDSKEQTVTLRAEIKNYIQLRTEQKELEKAAKENAAKLWHLMTPKIAELKEIMGELGEVLIVADGLKFEIKDIYGAEITDDHAFKEHLEDVGLFRFYAKVNGGSAKKYVRDKMKECKDDNERALLEIPGAQMTFYQGLDIKEVKS